MDQTQLRNRVFRKAAASPWTSVPGVLGGVAVGVGVVVASPVTIFAGVLGLLAAAGAWATQLLVGADRLTQKTFREMQAEEAQAQDRKLDELYRKLRKDDDSHSQRSLRRLRELYERFRETPQWTPAVDLNSAVEIAATIEKLFAACVASLDRSLEMWEAARQMATETARNRLLEQRRQLLAEVAASIDQFAVTVDEVQELALTKRGSDDLARFRHDLDQSLEVARRVEQRMHDLESELAGPLEREKT